MVGSVHVNGSANGASGTEERLDELRRLLGKSDGDLLKIVSIGAGAWGSVFAALLQDAYGHFREKVQIRVWRRPGRAVDRSTAEHLFDVINSREHVLRRLIRRCAYLKYVEARLGDRTLYADEILRDGFCLNMVDTPLCPMKVVTNLQEAVWDADIVVNGLPSTETREVFEELSKYWKERISVPVIISLAKGIEASLDPIPRIITPTQMISSAAGVPTENILYLGGPNIASEIYNKEYANARICGSTKWRKPLAKFLRQPHFIVWDNSDIVTHEVMGGLKNVYAIGADPFTGAHKRRAGKPPRVVDATNRVSQLLDLPPPPPGLVAAVAYGVAAAAACTQPPLSPKCSSLSSQRKPSWSREHCIWEWRHCWKPIIRG